VSQVMKADIFEPGSLSHEIPDPGSSCRGLGRVVRRRKHKLALGVRLPLDDLSCLAVEVDLPRARLAVA